MTEKQRESGRKMKRKERRDGATWGELLKEGKEGERFVCAQQFVPLLRLTQNSTLRVREWGGVLVQIYMCMNMCLFACLDQKVCVRGAAFYEFKGMHMCVCLCVCKLVCV